MVDQDAPPIPYDSMGFDPRLEAGFHSLGFDGTRPVQGAVIPIALEGHDVVACAETGTGKTLAFAVPIIERLLSATPGYGDPAREAYTRALILAPTRELAVQIEDSIVGLTYNTPVTSAAVFGGVEMGPQERALQAGVDIVVATPGRLMDHMRHSNTDFVRVDVLVLDEADRMMDMGFWPDVQKIMAALPPDRQTLLFSATLPGEIQRMATDVLKSPRYVQVGKRGGAARTIDHQMVQGGLGRDVYQARLDGPRARVRPSEDRCRSRGPNAGIQGDQGGGAARGPLAAGTVIGGRRLPLRTSPGAGGHRHRRAWPRHRGHCARH
jgi:ATP-dependent RNA helicase RhlE